MTNDQRNEALDSICGDGTAAALSIFAALPAVKARVSGPPVTTFDLYWGPEGKKIGQVQAKTARAAIRKAPMPYRKYLGEIYAVAV